MAKAKTQKPRSVKDLPPRPPQDLHEAVLFGALSEATEEVVQAYVNGMYSRGKMSAKERREYVRALMILATVGFAFRNWHLNR